LPAQPGSVADGQDHYGQLRLRRTDRCARVVLDEREYQHSFATVPPSWPGLTRPSTSRTESIGILSGLWLDDWFASTDSTGSVALLRNALGSTIALVNSSGSIATQDSYEPFGKTAISGSATTNPYAFAGRELDTSGLYFMRARYYNPLLSRFISSDPLGLGGGQANFFAYAYNSPMNFVDPLGLSGSSGGSPPQPNDGYDYTHEMPSPATTPGGGVNGNIQPIGYNSEEESEKEKQATDLAQKIFEDMRNNGMFGPTPTSTPKGTPGPPPGWVRWLLGQTMPTATPSPSIRPPSAPSP
jgi:RHS repeat-associated protein